MQVKDFDTHVEVSCTNVKAGVQLEMNIVGVYTSAIFPHELWMIFQWCTLESFEILNELLQIVSGTLYVWDI